MTNRVMEILYPIADALAMDFDMKGWRLFGDMEIELDLIEGIPVSAKPKIVSSVVDTHCGTVGVVAHILGHLYLGMINDDRVKKLTFFVIDGKKAGLKANKTGRISTLDNLSQWSRKKFYSMIAPGVKATFSRSSYEETWEVDSVGPEEAMIYLKLREDGMYAVPPGQRTKTADELNAENDAKRKAALTGRTK